MRYPLSPSIGLLGLLLLPTSHTQAQSETAVVRSLPPQTVSTDTIAVARFNLTAIDVKAAISMASGGESIPNSEIVETSIQSTLNTLKDAGVSDVYVTVPASGLPNGALCFIIPCKDSKTVSMLCEGMVGAFVPKPLTFKVLQQTERVIVCPAVLEPQFAETSGSRTERQDLLQGIESVSKFPHQAVFSLTDELHDSLARIFPENLGADVPTDFSPKRWISNVRTLALGFSLPPKLNLEVHMMCKDSTSSKFAIDEVKKLLQLVPQLSDNVQVNNDGSFVSLTIDPKVLQDLVSSAIDAQRNAASRAEAMNNLRQIGLAIHNAEQVTKFIIPTAIKDKDGRPLLSWRVALLPYIEQADLYKKFKLDEPWDSAHNKPLIAEMPSSYADSFGETLPPGMTRYRLPVFEGSVWSTQEPLKFKEITDGLSNTIWVVRAPTSAAIEWTNPEPWELDANHLKGSIFGQDNTAIVSFGDGSVRFIRAENTEENLRLSIQYADGKFHELK